MNEPISLHDAMVLSGRLSDLHCQLYARNHYLTNGVPCSSLGPRGPLSTVKHYRERMESDAKECRRLKMLIDNMENDGQRIREIAKEFSLT